MSQPSVDSPPQNNGVATAHPLGEHRPIESLASLGKAMAKWRPQLEKIAPPGRTKFDFARFESIVMSCASRTPKVLLCSYYSLRQVINSSAEVGLELGGVSGEAFIVPFLNKKKLTLPNGSEQWIDVLEATFIPGYKGFLRLAYESGLFRDLGCDVILPDDVWEPMRRGPTKLLWGHTQNEPSEHPKVGIDAQRWKNNKREDYKAMIAPLRGAYAFVKMANPEADDIVKPIWFARLEEIRRKSKAGMDGPWITDYHEMAKKTAIRNLWKHIPKGNLMRRVEELDAEFDFEESQRDARVNASEPIAVIPPADATKAKTDRVAERVRANAQRPAGGVPTPPPAPSSRPDTEPPNHDGDAPTSEEPQ